MRVWKNKERWCDATPILIAQLAKVKISWAKYDRKRSSVGNTFQGYLVVRALTYHTPAAE